MELIRRGQSPTPANPVLTYFKVTNGLLTDITGSLEYRVFDISDDPKLAAPVQVFPSVAGTRQSIDLTNDRLGVGRYIPTDWTVDDTAPLGRYEIRWYEVATPGAREREVRKKLEVTPDMSFDSTSFYCSLSDLRSEGLTVPMASDVRALGVIDRASRMVERWTGRMFEAQFVPRRLVDGPGSPVLLLNDPIIGVEEVRIAVSPFHSEGYLVSSDLFTVSNRHLTQNMASPDDRDSPKLEYLHASDRITAYASRSYSSGVPYHVGLAWNCGQQNIQIKGVWNYTEYDGSDWGKTPAELSMAVKLICFREFPQIGDFDNRQDRKEEYRVHQQRTEDQSFALQTKRSGEGPFTGDQEIDGRIVQFVRPPIFGAA